MAGPGRRALSWSLLAVSLTFILGTPAQAEELRYRLVDTARDLSRAPTSSGEAQLELPRATILREPGRPLLPVRRLEFLVPEGFAVGSVRVLGGDAVPVGTTQDLAVAGPWISDEGETAAFADPARADVGPWPAEPAALVADQFFHGFRIATIEVRPVRVEVDGSLSMLEQLEVVLELVPAELQQTVVRRQRDLPEWNQQIREKVRRRVVNPGDIARAGGPAPAPAPADALVAPGVAPSLNSSPVRHLILTTAALAPEFERLAAHRIATGLPSVVVTLEDVLANARQGVDVPETVREYIRDAYSWWGVDYVLIGGDTELIPVRYARSTFYPGGSYSDVPTDHYYACLDGNWNADGDALFGEHFRNAVDTGDFVDLQSELAVGRAPVKTATEAATFVDKVLEYEIPLDKTYQTGVLIAAEVLFDSDWQQPGDTITMDGAALSESLIDSVFTPCADPSVTVARHYQNYYQYPGSTEESAAGVFTALNTGNYGVFHHVGHGFYFNISMGTGQLVAADADVFQNGPNWFMMYSLNCSSSAFDFNCLNERMLTNPNGGSVISIGSARAAFPSAASDVQEAFYEAWMCGGMDRVGDAFEASRAPFLDNTFYNTIERWTQLVYCLLGDPATRLWGATPATAKLASIPTITLGDEQLQLTVVNDVGPPLPVAGVTVTARKGLEAYAVGATDGAGVVNFDFAPETTGDVDVWISGGGIVPKKATVAVQSLAAPVVSVQATSILEDGSAGSVGNGNGSAEAGETVLVTPLLVNGGTVAVGVGGSATLRSYDPFVTVLDSVVVLPALGAGAQVWATDRWAVEVSPDAPDEHSTVLEVALAPALGASRLDYVTFGLAAPEAEIIRLEIDDSAGDADGVADLGETVGLKFTLRNYGTGAAEGLSATLTVASGAATIFDGFGSWPDLPTPLTTADNAANPFSVRLDALPTSVVFEFTLTDAAGRTHVRQFDLVPPVPVENLFVAKGTPSSLRIGWDPSAAADLMGYLVYRRGPGDVDFVLNSPDVLFTAATFESTDLISLANYEFQVVTVDSAGLRSSESLALTATTYPPEIACFPSPIGLETSGALAVGTVDHDLAPELVVGSDYVYVIDGNCTEKLDGDGDSQTLGPINALAGQYQPAGIALGDLYKDRLGQEIVACDQNTRKVYVLDDQGNVMPGWPRTLMNWAWSTPAIGDLDGDGDLEIVINDIGGYTYAFNHDGTEVADGDANPGTIGPIAPRRSQDVGGTIYNESWGRSSPALFDVDGDGGREILFGSKYQNINAPEFFYALKGDGSGQNAPGWPKQLVPRSEFLSSATVADLENDGMFEIIAVSENDSLYVWDELGNLRPGFPVRRIQDAVKANSVCPSPAVGDFDEDGTLEIVFVSIVKVASSTWESRLEILGADGSTWPGWPVTMPDLSESSPIVADLDGDGSLDIVYGIGGNGGDDALYAFDVGGQDLAGFPIPLDGFVRATPTVCDLNRDGQVNLVSASWDSQIHVWNLLAPYDESRVPWPTFRGNVNRTGVYQDYVETAAPEAIPHRRVRLGPPRPNPFNPATELSFELTAESSEVQLVIYDALGRHVRTLSAGQFGPGVHLARWDGSDQRGRPVASGVYFAHLLVDGERAGTRKLALVK